MKKHSLGDILGISLASLCLVHCVGILLAVSAATFGGFAWILSEDMHEFVIGPVAVLLVIFLPLGYRKHRIAMPLWLGGAGLFLLVASLFLSDPATEIVAITGTAGVFTAHLLNMVMSARHTPTP